MRLQPGTKTRVRTAILVFFLIGLFDIILLFARHKSAYPFPEKVIGAAFFLSIYILIGAIFGAIVGLGNKIVFTRRQAKVNGPELFPTDLILYATLIFFLALMYFVHTKLIAKPFLTLLSAIVSMGIFLLSAGLYVFLYKTGKNKKWPQRLSSFTDSALIRRIVLAIFIFALITFPLTACYFSKFPFYPFTHSQAAGQMEQSPTSQNPNVILITVDTLRADYIGCSGKTAISTPNIDALAKGGVTFVQAVAQASLTTPSHASILTGTYVRTHGARDNCEFLNESIPTLAEVLRNNGYVTAAFVSGYPLKSTCCGIDRGFGEFNDQFSRLEACQGLVISRLLDKLHLSRTDTTEQKAKQTNAKALYWLKKNNRKRFFLWVHFYDPHTPYAPPKQFKSLDSTKYKGKADGYSHNPQYWQAAGPEDISEMVSLYKAEISYTDSQIGILLAELKRLNLDRRTLVVFTADHGEALAEHGKYFAHQTLYDHDTQVPLILSGQNNLPVGKSVTSQVQSIDIMPTVLDVLNIPIPKSVEGASLLSVISGDDSAWPEESYSERREYVPLKTRSGKSPKGYIYSLRTPLWKLILFDDGTKELYNLKQDERETQNIVNAESSATAELFRKLDEYRKQEAKNEPRKRSEMSEETREKLRSLGYIK